MKRGVLAFILSIAMIAPVCAPVYADANDGTVDANNTVSISTDITPSITSPNTSGNTTAAGTVDAYNTNTNMADSVNSSFNASVIIDTLTVDQAAQYAINASSTISGYSDTAATNNENIDSLKDQFNTATDYGTVLSLAVQIMQAQTKTIQNSNNANLARDQLRYSIMNLFASIISAQNSLTLLDQSLDIQQKQLKIAKVKYNLGYMSKLDMDTQTNTYNQKVASRQTQQIAIDNAFISLNKSMGTTLNKQYNLILDVGEYKPVGDINLSGAVASAIANDPSVVNQQGNVDVANYQIQMYDPDVSASSLDDLNRSLNSTQRTLSDTQSNVAQKVISAYNNIKNEEVSYSNAVLALEALNIQLPITQKQLELGKKTQLDLDQLQYQIAQQQETIRSLAVTHAINVMQFNEPATLSGGSGGMN